MYIAVSLQFYTVGIKPHPQTQPLLGAAFVGVSHETSCLLLYGSPPPPNRETCCIETCNHEEMIFINDHY